MNHSMQSAFGNCLALALVSMVMLSFAPAEAKDAQETELRLLILTGGHEFEREEFFTMFHRFKNVRIIESKHPEANTWFTSDRAELYDVLVFYDMMQVISPEQKDAFVKLLEKGKGAVFLHHSIASYQDWDEFEKILGGRYYLKPYEANGQQHPGSTYKHDVDLKVHIEDTDHPVTKGMKDFKIHDEVYNGFFVQPNMHPLLSTDHPKSGKIIGWSHQYGASRIVYLQLGHDHSAYQNKNFQGLVEQSVKWVAGKE